MFRDDRNQDQNTILVKRNRLEAPLLVGIFHLFNGVKGLGVSLLSGLGQWLLMETPLPWHATIFSGLIQ